MPRNKNKTPKQTTTQSFLCVLRDTSQMVANITLSLIRRNDFHDPSPPSNRQCQNFDRIKRSDSCPDRFVHRSRIDDYEQPRIRSNSAHGCRLGTFGKELDESQKLTFAKILEILKMENRTKELDDALLLYQQVLLSESAIDCQQNMSSDREARSSSGDRNNAGLRESDNHETVSEGGENDENLPGPSREVPLNSNSGRSNPSRRSPFHHLDLDISIPLERKDFIRSKYAENFESFEKFFNLYLDKLDVCECDFKVNRDTNGDRRPNLRELALHAHHRAQASNFIETMILKVIKNPTDADVPYEVRQILRNIPKLFDTDKVKRMRDERERYKALAIQRANQPKQQSSLLNKRRIQVIDFSEPPPVNIFEGRLPYHPVVMYQPTKREIKLETEKFVMTRRQYRMTANYNANVKVLKFQKELKKSNLLGRGPESRKKFVTIPKSVDG